MLGCVPAVVDPYQMRCSHFFCDLKFQFTFSNSNIGGGFESFLFSPLPGEMIQFDERLKPPTSNGDGKI